MSALIVGRTPPAQQSDDCASTREVDVLTGSRVNLGVRTYRSEYERDPQEAKSPLWAYQVQRLT